MLSNTLDQLHGSLLFAGKSRPSALFNEDDFDYALELQPCDEYRQVAEALPDICEFGDIDYELYQGDDNWQPDEDYGRIDGLQYDRGNVPAEAFAPEDEPMQRNLDEENDHEADPLQSSAHLITKAEYTQRMQFLARQQRCMEHAARRSSIGFQSHFPSNDKDIMDRFLLLLAQGVSVRRHQSYKRAETVILHSHDGCRAIHWDPPHRHHKQQKQVLQPHHYHNGHRQRQQKLQVAASGSGKKAAAGNTDDSSNGRGCYGCFSSTTINNNKRFGHGEHGDEESQQQPVDNTSPTESRGCFAAWFDHYYLTNFGFIRSGEFGDLCILSVHPASREDPTLPGMLGTEQLRASKDVFNSELAFSVIFESSTTAERAKQRQPLSSTLQSLSDAKAGPAVCSLDVECDDLLTYHTLLKGFKLLQEQAAKRRERGLQLSSSSSSSSSDNRLRSTRNAHSQNSSSSKPNKLSSWLPFTSKGHNHDSSARTDPASALFAATRSIDALRAIKIGGGLLLEQRPKGGGNGNNNSPDRCSKAVEDPALSLHEQHLSNKLPVAQFLGWTSAGTQIWARLKMAGLLVKVSFSWDLRRLILKIKCPRWRLEQMAQQMHLKLKTRDGHLRPFRVSRRDSFAVPYGCSNSNNSSIFRSSERQQIIDYILRSKIVEGGAELDEHSELGAHIVQRFPLHMYSRLVDLRQVWVRFWRRESPGHIAQGWSVFSVSYAESVQRVTAGLTHFGNQLLQQPLDSIAEYFGESMAFYFAFLAYYTRWLIVPAILGVIVFIVQVTSGKLDNAVCCAPYAILLMVWVALLLAYWRQEESTLAYRWGVLDFEIEETERPQFTGQLVYDDSSHEWRKVYPIWRRVMTRYMISIPVIIVAVMLTLAVMATVFYSQAKMYTDYEQGLPLTFVPSLTLWLGQSSGQSTGSNMTATLPYAPQHEAHQGPTSVFHITDLSDSRFWAVSFFYPCLYGMLASLLAVCFDRVAKGLNEFENHRTGTSYTNHLIVKVFSFQFVAIFTSLYYYAFFLPSSQTEQAFARIAVTIVSFMTVGQWWAVFLNLAVPMLYQRTLLYQMRAQFAVINRRLFAVSRQLQEAAAAAAEHVDHDPETGQRQGQRQGQQQDVFTLQAAQDKLHRRERYLHQARSRCWEEALQSKYDDFADYTALVIQIAFILFFGAVFPLSPLLALINNLALIRLNAFKVCHARQRPIAVKHSGIGVWTDVLQLLSIGGLLTNCAFWGFVSAPIRHALLPIVGQGGLVLILFAYEQCILLFKYWLHVAVPKVPAAVVRAQIRERKSLSRRSFQRHHHSQQQQARVKQQQQQTQRAKQQGGGGGGGGGGSKGKGGLGQASPAIIVAVDDGKGGRKKSSIIDWFLRGSLLLPHSNQPVAATNNAAAAVDALRDDDDDDDGDRRELKASVEEDDDNHWDRREDDGEDDNNKSDESDGEGGRRIKAAAALVSRRPFASHHQSADDNVDYGGEDDSPFYLDPPSPSLSPPPYDDDNDREEEDYDYAGHNGNGWEENDYDDYLSPPPPDEEPEQDDHFFGHDPQTAHQEKSRLPSADYSELTFEEAAELAKYHSSHEEGVYYEQEEDRDLPQPPQKRYSYWEMNACDDNEEEEEAMPAVHTRTRSMKGQGQGQQKRQQAAAISRRGSQHQRQQHVRVIALPPSPPLRQQQHQPLPTAARPTRQASQSRSRWEQSRSPPQPQSSKMVTIMTPPAMTAKTVVNGNSRRSMSKSPPPPPSQQQSWGWFKQPPLYNGGARRQSTTGRGNDGGRGAATKIDLLQSIAPLGQQQHHQHVPRPRPQQAAAAPYTVDGRRGKPTVGRASTLKPFQSPPSYATENKAMSPFAFVNGDRNRESRENSPRRANNLINKSPPRRRQSTTTNSNNNVMSPQQLLQVHYMHQAQQAQTQQRTTKREGSVNPFSFVASSPHTATANNNHNNKMTRLEFD